MDQAFNVAGRPLHLMLIVMISSIAFLGCASSHDADRNPSSFDMPRPESNAHPASYLTEQFPVNRPLPQHNSSEVQFYFKKCSEVGGSWPKSATAYDCDYP